MRRWIAILIPTLALGCAITKPGSPDLHTRIIAADYESTFESTLEYVQERGFSPHIVDKRMRLIETEYRSWSGYPGFWTTGSDKRARIVATFKKLGPVETQLTLRIEVQQKMAFGDWGPANIPWAKVEELYEQSFHAIADKAEDLQRLRQQQK